MPQAPNKLLSRAEIRNILTDLRNEEAVTLVRHRDAFRKSSDHDEEKCPICENLRGRIDGLEYAIRHFGGRRG